MLKCFSWYNLNVTVESGNRFPYFFDIKSTTDRSVTSAAAVCDWMTMNEWMNEWKPIEFLCSIKSHCPRSYFQLSCNNTHVDSQWCHFNLLVSYYYFVLCQANPTLYKTSVCICKAGCFIHFETATCFMFVLQIYNLFDFSFQCVFPNIFIIFLLCSGLWCLILRWIKSLHFCSGVSE